MPAPALADPRCGALRSLGTRITGTGGKLGVFAWDHWHGLATRTGDAPVRKIQGKVVLGQACPALRPGPGYDVHALLGPGRTPWAGHVSQVDVQLRQARFLLQHVSHQCHHCMLWLVGRTHHALTGDMTIQVRRKGLLKPLNVLALLLRPWRMSASSMEMRRSGATCFLMRLLPGPPSGGFGVLRGHLGDGGHDGLQGGPRRQEMLVLLQAAFPAVHFFQHQAQRLLSGLRLSPVEGQAALRLLCPTRTNPASSRIASADVSRARAARPTALRNACPSRFKVSSTRPAPNSGVEARAARRCRAPKPPVRSANVTVRSSNVLSRLCAMSRMRKLTRVLWLQGGCSAPRQAGPTASACPSP